MMTWAQARPVRALRLLRVLLFPEDAFRVREESEHRETQNAQIDEHCLPSFRQLPGEAGANNGGYAKNHRNSSSSCRIHRVAPLTGHRVRSKLRLLIAKNHHHVKGKSLETGGVEMRHFGPGDSRSRSERPTRKQKGEAADPRPRTNPRFRWTRRQSKKRLTGKGLRPIFISSSGLDPLGSLVHGERRHGEGTM